MNIDIMVIEYKDYPIKVQWNHNKSAIYYNVWTPEGEYHGFWYTITDARKHIDCEIEHEQKIKPQ